MAKRKKTGLNNALFGGISPYESQDDDNQENEVTRIPLESIRPDRDQPRQLLPADLAEKIATGSITLQKAMNEWLARKEDANLTALKTLAGSIATDGLIQPITVRKTTADDPVAADVRYMIVTGERRFWSHVYLTATGKTIQEGKESHSPAQIRVQYLPEGASVRIYQIQENMNRSDVNALEKARGLLALREELSAGEEDQVPWRVVEERLHISKRYRIFLMATLKLSPEAQSYVQQNNLKETTIRPITQKLKDFPSLQLHVLKQIVTWQQENAEGGQVAITRSVASLVNHLLKQERSSPITRRKPQPLPPVDGFRKVLKQPMDLLARTTEDELNLMAREVAMNEKHADMEGALRELQSTLDELLTKIDYFKSE